MKNETNVDPYEKWDNTCIKVLSKEHGAKVIEFWKSVGIDTNGWIGNGTNFPYYGIFNGRFTNEDSSSDCRDLTLEEAIAIRDSETKTFPREMYVWDDNFKYVNKKVIVYICSDEELEKYNRTKRYIGFGSNYENAMEVEEYEAMNKNKEILDEISNTKKQMNELNDKLSQLQDKLKY